MNSMAAFHHTRRVILIVVVVVVIHAAATTTNNVTEFAAAAGANGVTSPLAATLFDAYFLRAFREQTRALASKAPTLTSSQRGSSQFQKSYIASSTVYEQTNCTQTESGYKCQLVGVTPLEFWNETGVKPLGRKFTKPWQVQTASTSPQWAGTARKGYVPYGQCVTPTSYEPNFFTSFQCRDDNHDVFRGCQLLLGPKGEAIPCKRVADCMTIDPISTCVSAAPDDLDSSLCVRCCCDGFGNDGMNLLNVTHQCRREYDPSRFKTREAKAFTNTMDDLFNRPACCTDQRVVCERNAGKVTPGGDGSEDVLNAIHFLQDKTWLDPYDIIRRAKTWPGYAYKGPRLPRQARDFDAPLAVPLDLSTNGR